MRILEVTQSYYPFVDRGGPAVKVRALARGLAARGEEVTVLTADLGLKRVANHHNAWVRDGRGWHSREDSVDTIYLRTNGSYRAMTWNPGVFTFCRDRLCSFDIVHIYGTYDLLGPAVGRACRRLRLPYIVEPIGMFRPIVRNIPLKKLYRRLMGDSLVLGAARVVATAEQERQELIEEGVRASKIVIRRNGLEVPEKLPARGAFRGQWNIPKDVKVVLFLGRLVTKKSPDLLIEAFSRWQANQAAPRALLVMAGPDEDGYRSKLEAMSAPSGVGKAIVFTGPLFDDVKWSAYRDADLFVLPSQNENFGNTAAEAVACDTPVVVTDRCGVAPLIDGRAGLVVPHDCAALAKALQDVFEQPQLYQRLKQGCASVVRSLSWQEPLNETQALYAELIRERQKKA